MSEKLMGATPLRGKRVAMVLFSYYPMDPRPRRAAEALADAGMNVEVICLRENGSPKREQVNGVNVRRVPITRRRGGILGYFYQYVAFFLVSFVIVARRSFFRNYGLIYVHNMPDFLVFSGIVPKIFGSKVVLDLHDPMPELMQTIFGMPAEALGVRLLRWVEKRSIGFADSVITVNGACARIFGSRSCPPEKITVVMNSPDELIFHPRSVPVVATNGGNRPFVVMYHGSLVERNGLALAVEAFERLRAVIPSAELRIYGSRNTFLDCVMQTVQEKGLANSVSYRGPRPLEEIVKAIETCDVGIIPNKKNIFTELNTPTRIFEYLALGKPVIAPEAPGITDYFDRNSLLFFELGNADDLAQKMEFVFRNPAGASEIARRGQEIYSIHTWRAERKRLMALVTGLLSESAEQVSAVCRASKGDQPGLKS